MRRPALVLTGVLLLAGCGTDPADEVRAGVVELTEAANARDAARVRVEADALVDLVEAQRSREQLDAAQAERLIALARSVRGGADVIDEDLLERRAEAEATAKQLEEAKKQLEEERKKAEEAARSATEEREGEDEGKGKGKGGDDKEEDDD